MLPILNAPDRIDLVLEQLLNAEALQSGEEDGRESVCSFMYGLNGREVPVVRSGRTEFGMVSDRIDKLGKFHGFSSILFREFFFKGTGDLLLTRFHLFLLSTSFFAAVKTWLMNLSSSLLQALHPSTPMYSLYEV
jgi:hypothetical protein